MFMGWGSNGWNQGGPQQNLATSNEVQNGFDHQAVISNLGTINGNVQNGFSNAEISRCNNTASIINGITNAAYASQQGLSDLRYQVATEGAADRTSLQQSLAEIMADNAQQTQNLMNRLSPAPVPAYVVANPNGCNCGTFNGCCGA